MPVGTFYSNTAGHGRLPNNNSNWTTLRNLTNSGPEANQGLMVTGLDSGTYYLYRVFLPFDTSAIPVGSIINSWSVSLYRDDSIVSFLNPNSTTIELLPSTQADPTDLNTNDFDNLSYVSKGSLPLSSISSNLSYFTIPGSDVSVITPGGYTKLVATTGRDLNNSAPTGTNQVSWQAAGETNPPYLTVDYTPPSGGSPMFFSGGVTIA